MVIKESFELARQVYEKWGINIEEVLENLQQTSISIHCWQGDDVKGFEADASELSGGLM